MQSAVGEIAGGRSPAREAVGERVVDNGRIARQGGRWRLRAAQITESVDEITRARLPTNAKSGEDIPPVRRVELWTEVSRCVASMDRHGGRGPKAKVERRLGQRGCPLRRGRQERRTL
jgi:hypothetical protein